MVFVDYLQIYLILQTAKMTPGIFVYSPSLHPKTSINKSIFLCVYWKMQSALTCSPSGSVHKREVCDVLLTFKWMNRLLLWIESNVESFRFGWRDGSGRKGQEKGEDVGGTWKRRIKGIKRKSCFWSEFSKRGFLMREFRMTKQN